MDIFSALPYLAGSPPENPGPLARFLPPVPEGVAKAFLEAHAGSGSWVLDPFGASPRLAVEMARAGYRVLVAVNNPVARFLLEMAANPPSRPEFQAALSELAASRKGDERLEGHLQSLYLTECFQCQHSFPAEAFIWERGGESPTARIVHCPQCRAEGEHATTPADRARSAELSAVAGLHRARALERVAALDDPDRVHAVEALDNYLPRAVYALITLINRLDGLPITPERRRCLTALILSACDAANSLWPHPVERPRPRQLIIPPRFHEHNVWLALEKAIDDWAAGTSLVPLITWPDHPPESGGICLFEGPLRDLAPRLKELTIGAVLSALPRPNQAFWTLSALWAGWLWGRQAVGPFRSVLRRRRYDWNWHASALHAAFTHLTPRLPLEAPIFALVAEPEPAYLSAVLLAGESAGFDLRGIALRTLHDPVQMLWQRRPYVHASTEKPEVAVVQEALRAYLTTRNEPVTYLHLHAASLAALTKEQALGWRADALTQIHLTIHKALGENGFIHLGESKSIETGLWGLKQPAEDSDSFADRVEIAIVRILQDHLNCSRRELDLNLSAEFPGLFTAPVALVQVVLQSYGIEETGGWRLRAEDDPSTRRADLETIRRSLDVLGEWMRFTVQHAEKPLRTVLWSENGQVVYAFYLLASAVIGRILWVNPHPPERSLLVLPGGRTGLLTAKLRRDPTLQAAWERGWRALKIRHLRRLAGMTDMTRDLWKKELSGDPIEPPEQMRLF